MENEKSISIYDLNNKMRYSFVAEVYNPVSHETVGINDWKRDRVLLHKVKVLINKDWLSLNNGDIIRIDIGKRLKELQLEKYDLLSFDGRVRLVPVDDYFDYDKRGEVRSKWGVQLSPRGNVYYGYGDEYYARTLGFLSQIEKN